jgi:cytochrome c-type biogenesis protein CcmE
MPPEVADALKRAGHWNPALGAPPPPATWNTMDPDRPQPAAATRTGS